MHCVAAGNSYINITILITLVTVHHFPIKNMYSHERNVVYSYCVQTCILTIQSILYDIHADFNVTASCILCNDNSIEQMFVKTLTTVSSS